MNTAPIKVKHYISPKTFAEYYFKASKEEISQAEATSRACVRRVFDEGFTYLDMETSLNADNVLMLSKRFESSERNKNFINICSLPLNFFETLQKELPLTTQSLAFNELAYNIQQRFITLIMRNIVAQTFTRVVGADKPTGSVHLRAEPLTFDDFKQSKDFEPYEKLSIHDCFLKVFKQLFNEHFYPEIDITKTPIVVKVFDFRNNANIEYELLSYILDDFEFLKHFHKELANVFVSEFFVYILHNNMQQILRGVKDEV